MNLVRVFSRTRGAVLLVLLGWVVSIAACGGGSSPTSPSSAGSQFPSVAGNYSGSATFTFTSLGAALTCPAVTTVTQSGSSVTLAPLTLSGNCSSVVPSVPLGNFTMTATGSLGTTTVNNLPVSSCNGSYNASASGGFFGSSLQFTFVYTAVNGGCVAEPGNFTFSANLNRT